MAETSETARYRAAWQDRRTRLRAVFAVLFAFAVLFYAVPSAVVAGVGIIATLAAAWHYASFRCPRCGDEFLSVPNAVERAMATAGHLSALRPARRGRAAGLTYLRAFMQLWKALFTASVPSSPRNHAGSMLFSNWMRSTLLLRNSCAKVSISSRLTVNCKPASPSS